MKKNKSSSSEKFIKIYGANEHNLKKVNVSIPRNRLVVITGVSGSGKSSLAFDTIFSEGQRKYMKSLSSYARQFLRQMHKADVENIEGLPPTIAIEQRSASHNPRSTVATTTEIYDYLRLLFSRCGSPLCWHPNDKNNEVCGKPIQKQSASHIISTIMRFPKESALQILSPVIQGKKGYHREILHDLQKEGFIRVRVDGKIHSLDDISMNNENPLSLSRYETHTIEAVICRTRIKESKRKLIADSIETGLKLSKGSLIALKENDNDLSWEEHTFSEQFSCSKHPECNLKEMEPRLFSFNSPFGACPDCTGLGNTQEFDLSMILDENLSISEGAFSVLSKVGYFYQKHYRRLLNAICRKQKIDRYLPFKKLDKKERLFLLYGQKEEEKQKNKSSFKGISHLIRQRILETENENVRKQLNRLLLQSPCKKCLGGRLRKEALHVFVSSKKTEKANIVDITKMSIAEAEEFFLDIQLEKEKKEIAGPILKEILSRLAFMQSVGLGYLNLNRATSSLSGGEAQRIRLASQVGTGLVGVCYVLDEPTIGLHQRDNERLIATLRKLVDIGNSVLIVEHDEEMMRSADYILDIGPGPGIHGGRLVCQGTIRDIVNAPQSITGKFLSGKDLISFKKQRRPLSKDYALFVKEAEKHNLKKINVHFPLRGLICVTGVSGSGKSTLVNEILLKELDQNLKSSKQKIFSQNSIEGMDFINRVIAVDQSPIGKTPRSNPATYTNLFDEIRLLFSKCKESTARGYTPGRFSFNVKGGRCEECQGQGTKKISMHFLADVYVECERCKGSRYNDETLEIRYSNKNIADVLSMTVEEAIGFFSIHPKIQRILKSLHEVGLDYIQLGQASTTLSGGEAQRVKLASELGRFSGTSIRKKEHSVYILDEPTTGLHFADIKKIIDVFHSLVDKNNTVIVIEHNLDVIKCADWIIDLGPEGGEQGGEIIAYGPPESVVKEKRSHTGIFLKKILESIP